MRSLLILLALLSSPAVTQAGESPREFARRFYAAHQTWTIRGVPTDRDESVVSPLMGIEIIRAFRRVNEHRELEGKLRDPEDPSKPRWQTVKPRWCIEGQVFCDNWEGITHYSVGKARIDKGRWIVEAHLEYIEGGKSYPWTDILVLDRAGENWVVGDIRYGQGGTLLTRILEELVEADKDIPKTPLKRNPNQGESGPRE